MEAFLAAKGGKTFGKLDVEALHELYVAVISRETGSTDAGYLVWKIREATKGTIPLGATRQTTPRPAVQAADPQDLAAALGGAWALLHATTEVLGSVQDARGELPAALVMPPDAQAELEARAMEDLRARHSGGRGRLPEDPRPA